MATFIRVVRENHEPPYGSKEILINLDTVWKIEVTYGLPAEEGSRKYVSIPVADALKNEHAIRFYDVYAGSERIRIDAQPDSVVCQAIEKIYKDAIKEDYPPKTTD